MKLKLYPSNWRFLLSLFCFSFISVHSYAQLNCNSTNGDSYGAVTGIEAWTFNHSGNAGNFAGNSSTNGDGDGNSDGDISNNSSAWGLWANSGGLANQITTFEIPFIEGDEIKIDMDNGNIETGSTVGFGLQNELGENLLEFYFVGGSSHYTINENSGPTATTVSYTDEGLSLIFTLNTLSEIGISIVDLASGDNFSYTSNLMNPSGGQAISKIRLFNANAGFNDPSNAFFNNLEVCQSITDADGDGWLSNLDCDDSNEDVNPDASEILFNDLDDDCNPATLDFNSGIFESTITLNQSYVFGDINGDPADFNGKNLGTYYCGDQYFLQSVEAKTFKCTNNQNADITSASFHYRVYEYQQTPGNFIEINLPFSSDDGQNFGCQDQTWKQDNIGIDLLTGLDIGLFIVEIYNTAEYTFTNGSGTHYTYDEFVDVAFFQISEDISPPVVICQDYNVVMEQDGTGILSVEDINNGSFDVCGISSMSISETSFTCEDIPTEPYSANELIISEYICNSNLDNYIEIFNGTPNPVDLANYELRIYYQGSQTVTATDNLGIGGVLAPNETAVFGLPGFSTTYQGPISFLPMYSFATLGAETIELFNVLTNERVDIFGAISEFPNNGWNVNGISSANQTLRRLPNVLEGNLDSGIGFPKLGLEWEQFPPTDLSGLGNHNYDYNVEPSIGVQLYATDEIGNTSYCTATVTFDIPLPVASCKNITVELDENGNASINAEDLNDNSTSSCSSHEFSATQTVFDCSHIGENTVSLTITDTDQSSNTCDAIVTVVDYVLPNVICQDITVTLDETGNASITAYDIDNGSNDACGISELSVSPMTFDYNDLGSNSVTLTVTDSNGNVNSCEAIVTVTGAVLPEAVCNNISVELDQNGVATIDASDVDGGSSAVLGIASLEVTQSNFDCSHIGSNSVTLTVTDTQGNFNTCEAIVTILDITPPMVICQDIAVSLNEQGVVSIIGSDVDNGSNDACGIMELNVFPNSFDCNSTGNNNVELTAIDNNGNVSSCTAVVTVMDISAPTAICQDITITLDETGTAILDPVLLDNGSYDNCSTNLTFLASPTEFDYSNIGPNSVELIVVDVNGTPAFCQSVVTVTGDVTPNAVCQNINVFLDESGSAIIQASDIDGGSSAPLGIATLSASQTSFGCSNIGENTVTLTVTDIEGNYETCEATVTVLDSTPPTAICQDISIILDESGFASILASQIDNGSNDACGISTITLSQMEFGYGDIGANSITMTVTDNNGNTNSCESTVTVEGDVSPEAKCTNLSVNLDETGSATISVEDIDDGSTAVLGINSLSLSNYNFNCSNIGENTVTLTVTDTQGNTASCNATVNVFDTNAPTALCQDVVVQLDENGTVTISADDVDAGSTDNCGIVSMSLDQYTFDCSDIESSAIYAEDLFISEYVEGSSNNKYIEIYNGTGLDIDLSNYSLKLYSNGSSNPNYTSSLANAGTIASGQVVVFRNATADIYSGTSYTNSAIAYNGDDAIALYNGNTVIDIIGSIGQDPGSSWSVNGNSTGEQSLRRNQNVTQGNTSNAIGFPSLGTEWTSASQNNVSNLGQHTSDAGASTSTGGTSVVFTVTDASGNTSFCSANVTIEDVLNPTTVCQDITLYLDENGEATISAEDVDGGSFDNCGDVSLSIDRDSFNCTDIASEASGSQAWINEFHYDNASNDVNEFIEVVANFDASSYQIDLYNGNGGAGYDSFTLGSAVSSNDGYNYYLLNLQPNGIQNGPDGISLSDINGNLVEFISYGGAFTANGGPADGVTSTDVGVDESSAAIGESLQRVGNGGQGTSFTWVGPALDSPGAENEGQNIGSGIATTIELTSIDGFGNTSSCLATLTVLDIIAPNVVCQNITVNLDENGVANISVEDIDNGSYDNCGLELLEIDIDSFDCSNVGITNVTLTATDVNGNTASCLAEVTVLDNENPIAICSEITVELDENGTATISPQDVNNGSSDNCGISSMELSQSSFSCADLATAAPEVGDQVWINELHYDNNSTDVNEGVEVLSNFDISGYSIVAYNGSNGTSYLSVNIESSHLISSESGYDFYSIPMPGLQNGAPDGIALVNVNNETVEFISYEGSFTATNGPAAGLSSTDIVVSESSSSSSNHSLQLTGTGLVRSDFTWTDSANNTFGGPNNNQEFGSLNDNIIVDLIVTDNSGNQSTCSAVVNVVDLMAPNAICQNITISLDENGSASIRPSDIDGGSNDNCSSILITSISQSQFDCSHIGDNSVVLTVIDESGNESTCVSVVTVTDNLAPTAICQNITIQLDDTGNASISASDIDNGSFDNCGDVILSLDNDSFNCSDTGLNEVILTVADENGNTSTCTALVNVLEDIAPIVFCQNTTIYLDVNGLATISTSDIDNGSFDNCGPVSLSLSRTNFDCSQIGDNSVTLTVTDGNGNQSACEATVNVVDMMAPNVICQTIDIQLDENNVATISADDIDAGSTDNCGIATRTISQSNFDCSHMGENIVTLLVTDTYGNSSTCDAIVNVIDPIAPTVYCQNVLLLLDANGEATLNVNQIDAGSYDNCGIADISLSQTLFDCGDFGGNNVTMTVTDNYGNSSSCEAYVTVLDNIAPNAVGQNLILSLDENGQASITPEDLNNGSYDNCGIASITASQTEFDCSDLGTNTVIMTASDLFGNSSNFGAIVTVVDNTVPIIDCHDLTLDLGTAGFVEVSPIDLIDNINDNCSLASVEITSGPTYFSCDDEGESFELVITVIDNSGNQTTCSSIVSIIGSVDSDGDGISDVCDFCFGDNSLGDADGDGICDVNNICPGSEDLLDYDAECGSYLSLSSGNFSANNGGIYCIDGVYNGLQISISNGSTVRLSGAGNVTISVQYNSTLEIMSGANIHFNNINVNWGAIAMVVHSEAIVSYNGNFSPSATVVNCGTISVDQLTINYDQTFINNHTVEINHFKKTSSISGDLYNYGLIHSEGAMTLTWNGEIFNHCQIEIERDFNVQRNVRNYAFINVGGKTTVSYNGRVHQYDAAMMQTESTNIQGRYVGYGNTNFVKILGNTTMSWNGKFEGSLAVCDIDGFENISSPTPFINGAAEDCSIFIPISECNPIGNEYIPNPIAINGDNQSGSNASLGESISNISSRIDEIKANQSFEEINIWPNPTNGKATLAFTPGSDDRLKVDLYAIDGSLVESIFEGDVRTGVVHTEHLDLSRFENGVYFIRIVQNENVQTRKIVFTR